MAEHRIRYLLKKYQVGPKRARGQSFLLNRQIARTIVDKAKIAPEDTVLEIGPGLGVLTSLLVNTGAEVVAIEIEPGLVRALRDLFSNADNLEIIQGDALQTELPDAHKVVSNLPYNIASQITFKLLSNTAFECAVLMYQKEFAERLLANPGDSVFSRVSVNFQYQASAERVADVEARDFYPEPAVDSTVLKIKKNHAGPQAKDEDVFRALVRGIFSYPNKYLRNALGIWLRNLGAKEEMADEVLDQIEENMSEIRPRCLTISQIVNLADILADFHEKGLIPIPRS